MFRNFPQVGVGFTMNVQGNNKSLLSAKNLSDVNEDGMSHRACQIGSCDFVRKVIYSRWTGSTGGKRLMFTLWLMSWQAITLNLMCESPADSTAGHDFLVC